MRAKNTTEMIEIKCGRNALPQDDTCNEVVKIDIGRLVESMDCLWFRCPNCGWDNMITETYYQDKKVEKIKKFWREKNES